MLCWFWQSGQSPVSDTRTVSKYIHNHHQLQIWMLPQCLTVGKSQAAPKAAPIAGNIGLVYEKVQHVCTCPRRWVLASESRHIPTKPQNTQHTQHITSPFYSSKRISISRPLPYEKIQDEQWKGCARGETVYYHVSSQFNNNMLGINGDGSGSGWRWQHSPLPVIVKSLQLNN